MILVAGGTGTVGHKVVQALLAKNVPVRLIARGFSDWKDSTGPELRRSGVDVVTGDLRDPRHVLEAAAGCQGIINVSGVLRDTPGNPVEAVNVESVENLVAAAKANSIQRFVHLSCLGATQFSDSKYLASKWHSEGIVKRENFYWTIFRPSLIFGTGCHLVKVLDYWVGRLPFLPVIGSGINHIQPVAAQDVADCIVQSLYNRDTVGQVYDLVGPQTYTLTELLELTSQRYGRKKPYFKLPAQVGYALARLIERLSPRGPFSEDVAKLMTTDLSGDPTLMQKTFQVEMLSMETILKPIADWRSS